MKNTDDPSQLQPLVTEPRMAQDAIEPNVTEPTPEVCRNCRWWEDVDGESGQCRIRAPIAYGQLHRRVDDIDDVDAFWPWSRYDDWCGEFQVRPKDTKQCVGRDDRNAPAP